MNGLDLKKIREEFGFTQSELAERLQISRKTINSYENGANIPASRVLFFENFFHNLKETIGLPSQKTTEEIKEELENLPSGGLRIKEYPTKLAVRLVTNKAQAGWSEGYYADEYLEDMPIVMIDADQEYKGKYLAFEVVGDSMEPDYLEGDIVICREVQRHLWSYKLHYNDWDFVIAHATQGIMLKEITAHNVEKGIITCHSINPAHKDFKVNLREVTYLYNVVEIRQKGSRKRWNRAKDFYTEENT